MSTIFADIQGALRARLYTLTNKPPIAWENVNYEPSSNVLYLRPTTLQAPTLQACLGDTGRDIHEGIFQVDVFIPDNSGRTTWPDDIADHFSRGTRLTQNTVSVTITTVSTSAGIKDNNFYIVPVSISYRAFTGAR